MAYSEILAERVAEALRRGPGVLGRKVEAKKMMGGVTFMVNGKMCVGVLGEDIMARIDPAVHDDALKRKGCRVMDFTGKPMKGFVFVGPAGTKADTDLAAWVDLALDYNGRAKASRKSKTAGKSKGAGKLAADKAAMGKRD